MEKNDDIEHQELDAHDEQDGQGVEAVERVGDEEGLAESDPSAAEQERYPVPKVWVASLSDYNAGRLHGAWVAVKDEESLRAGIRSVLASSSMAGAEEWAIHDYDGFFPVQLGEHESVADVAGLAVGIATHGPAFAHYASLVGWRDSERLRHFDEAYEGHFENLADYGESVVDGFGLRRELEEATPELLQGYVEIRVGAFARDMEAGGLILTSAGDGGVYVFEAGD